MRKCEKSVKKSVKISETILPFTMLPRMIAILILGNKTGKGKVNTIRNSPPGGISKGSHTPQEVVVILVPVSKNKKGKGKGKVIHNSEPRKVKLAGHHLPTCFHVSSFPFWPPLLATPLPPLLWAPFRPVLPLKKCSVL